MNYNKLYQRFIESRPHRNKVRGDGLETHHIKPKSLGGKDIADNKIVLTFKEHWLAHKILTKIYKGTKKAKMIYALYRMSNHHNNHKITGRRYHYTKQLRLELVRSKKIRKKLSKQAKERWQDLEYRKNRSIGLLKSMKNIDTLKIMSKKAKERWQDITFKKSIAEKISLHSKIKWEDPTYKEKLRQKHLERWKKIKSIS